MNQKEIDFYVPVIDNFGDVGFALNIALSYHVNHPETHIRFYVEDPKVYNLLTQKEEYDFMEVFPIKDLVDDPSIVPASLIFNFFNRRIDENNLSRFPHKKTIINFDYLQFHSGSTTMRPGVKSLHLTQSELINGDTVIHFIPSLLKEGGGVVIHPSAEKRKESLKRMNRAQQRGRFIKEHLWELGDIFESFLSHDWYSVFSYEKNLDQIMDLIHERKGKEVFWIFEKMLTKKEKNAFSWIDLRLGEYDFKENVPLIIATPFMHLEDYLFFLSLCDANFTRGENSFIGSLVHGIPTLWDIYKEDNNAHTEKLSDFLSIIGPSLGENEALYAHTLQKFNAHWEDVKFSFHTFLDNKEKFAPGFHNFSEYIHKDCNLLKKLDTVIRQG